MTANLLEEDLKRLAQTSPDAYIVAIDAVGLITKMPRSLTIPVRSPSEAIAGVDLVGRESRAALVSQFLHVPVNGVNRQIVKTASGEVATCYVFELTASHGVCVVLIAPGINEELVADEFIYEAPFYAPRYSRFVRDREARVIEADSTLSIILGFSIREIQERNIISFIHPEDRNDAIVSWYEAVFKETGGKVRWRCRLRTKSNEWRWVEFTDTNYLRHDVFPHIVTEMVDIHAEVMALEKLHTNTLLLERLTDVLPVGVVHFDTDLNLTFVNDRLLDLLQIPADRTSPPDLSLVNEEDRAMVLAAMKAALDGNDGDITARFCLPGSDTELYAKLAFRALVDLRGSVNGVVLTIADITAEVVRRRDLELRASYDGLTGAFNRESIYKAIADELANMGTSSRGLAVLFADLNGFKAINDKLGHAAGDELLRKASAKINTAIRTDDKVGRIGGDEFVVLCPDLASPDTAMEVGLRIIASVNEVQVNMIGKDSLGVSVGVVWTRRPRLNVEAVVDAADYAMYTAKRGGEVVPILVEL